MEIQIDLNSPVIEKVTNVICVIACILLLYLMPDLFLILLVGLLAGIPYLFYIKVFGENKSSSRKE